MYQRLIPTVERSGLLTHTGMTESVSLRERTGRNGVNRSVFVHGQPARLLVDTGSFVTIFTEPVLKSLGAFNARFPTGTSRKVSAAQINDLKIGISKCVQENSA